MGLIHQLSESAADIGYRCKMGMDYWLGRICAVYAELYKNEGDQSKAKESLNKAIEILKECGADSWVDKADLDQIAKIHEKRITWQTLA